MDSSSTVELLRTLIFTGLYIVSPALIISFIVAIMVGIVQAVMQIQEQTLSFFPKLIALFFIFYFMMPWMLDSLVQVVKDIMDAIPSLL